MQSNLITRFQHRRYVKNQGILDKKSQEKEGLHSFPEDWKTLMTSIKIGKNVPRKVWMLWLQGEEEAPPLVRAAFESWRTLNPGWQVTVLNEDSISDYIDIPHFPVGVSSNHRANIIRLILLSRYGGVWADATTLCLRPLDEWIDHVMPRGFFAFAKPQPLRPLANWFIVSQPNSPATDEWLKWSLIYILNTKRPSTYFWSHFTFKWILEKDSDICEIWQNTPQISAKGPHILQRILDGDLSPSHDPTDEEMAMLPLVKLNWKKGYTIENIDKELSKRGIDLAAVKSGG